MPIFLFIFLSVSLGMTVVMGRYMALVFEGRPTWGSRFLGPIEGFLLRCIGVSQVSPLSWQAYARQLLWCNFFCGVLAFFVLLFQHILPLNPTGLAGLEPLQAFNVIASFVTNTNWQNYSGEATLSNLSQMLAITFLQVVGAASGIAVCVAFLRGLTQRPLGHFYQDFIKTVLYLLLPLLVIGALFFVSQGVPQTLQKQQVIQTVEGQTQTLALGPVASLLAIKQWGTNGGGFFNANSAHPFENPTPLTNMLSILMELAIPMGLVFLFGIWLQDRRQAWMIWGGMMLMFLLSLGVGFLAEQRGNPLASTGTGTPIDQSLSRTQSGGYMEGKEVRFEILPSLLFTTATTATSTGAVNNMHDSLTPVAGMVPMMLMMTNVVFGGVGVGLMGFLLFGIIAVFLTGLMVGRTPEIFGKKIEKPEIVLASLTILVTPVLILVPTAISVCYSFGLSSLNTVGPHGFGEVLYAYTSAAANNGSAFAGLSVNTPWYNITLGAVILMGRYLSIIALLAISGSLLQKTAIQSGVGTLKTNTFLFMSVWVAVILIVGALTFVPALFLGPISEQLAMHAGLVF